jgi:hypothetical protein
MTRPEMPAHVAKAWDDLRPDTSITRCRNCGGWMFATSWCDYCNPDRDPWS